MSLAQSEAPGTDRDPLAVADGAILTHVLTAEEREAGVLRGDGDLDLWVRLAAAGLPLADGGAVVGHLTHHSGVLLSACTELRGPAGWLDAMEPDTVIGLRLRDGALELSAVDESVDPSLDHVGTLIEYATDLATGALREFLDDEDGSTPSASVALDHVVLSYLDRQPGGLAVPAPPLEMLFSIAGLDIDHGALTLPGAPHDQDDIGDLTPEEVWARVQTAVLLSGAEFATPEECEALLRLLSVPAALEFAATTVEIEPMPAEALMLLRESAGAGPAEQAAAALLAARSAEGEGDSPGAEALVTEALRHHPTLTIALFDAAEYAATRGDFKTANEYLRRANDPDSPLRATIAPLTIPPDTGIGRNVPCPCGSGKKYKACCLLKEKHPLSARATALYVLLTEYAQRVTFAEALDGLEEYSHGGILDALALDLMIFDLGALNRFLATRSSMLRDDERELLESWIGVPILPYEIAETGQGLTLVPMLGGDPVELPDADLPDGPGSLAGLIAIARMLPDGEGPTPLFPPYLLNADAADEVRDAWADFSPYRLMELMNDWVDEDLEDEPSDD